jgi:BMFP domain-containing protein YqiC
MPVLENHALSGIYIAVWIHHPAQARHYSAPQWGRIQVGAEYLPEQPGASPPHTVLPSAHHYKDAVVMPDQPFIDRLMADISRRLPTDLGGLRSEVERNVRSVLAETVSRLDLITREEFDIQQQVLLRTREKLEALEKQVAELEKAPDA